MRTPLLATLALLSLSAIGCALSPAQLQTDNTLAVTLALNAAAIFDPAEKPNIDKYARIGAQVLDQTVIPQFFPNASSAQLTSAAATQVMTFMGTKLNSTVGGAKVMEAVTILEIPLQASLGTTASPTSLLSATARAYNLAFWTSCAQGCANYLKDPTLNPPVPPPAPAPPPPTPTPAPVPSPTPPAPVPAPTPPPNK
jgi:hypothetical protein